jgi:hypothetical protein
MTTRKASSKCVGRYMNAPDAARGPHCPSAGHTRDGRARLRRHRGAALPGVVLLASAMLATSIASFDASIAAVRRAANFDDYLRAANAADAALTLCARALDAGVAPVLASPAPGEPVHWRQPEVFEGPAAFAPVPEWPGSSKPPQCIIESGRLALRPNAQAYWVSARGFGSDETALAWLQLVVVREDGAEERRWRRIVQRPS